MRLPSLTFLSLLAAAPLAAHPHIFVEAEVELVVAKGALQGVRLAWTYDDFFSFLLTADLGIDSDGDMVLDDAELAILTAAVLDWPADYEGDLVVDAGEGPVALGPRIEAEVEFTEGRVTERHYRPLVAPVSAPVTVQVYDPWYYVAYEIAGPPQIAGEGCSLRIEAPDPGARSTLVAEVLGGREPEDYGTEEDFPKVGDAFADRLVLTCAE